MQFKNDGTQEISNEKPKIPK